MASPEKKFRKISKNGNYYLIYFIRTPELFVKRKLIFLSLQFCRIYAFKARSIRLERSVIQGGFKLVLKFLEQKLIGPFWTFEICEVWKGESGCRIHFAREKFEFDLISKSKRAEVPKFRD